MSRRILAALALSFVTVFVIQYFTSKSSTDQQQTGAVTQDKIRPGQFYSAPGQQTYYKKPDREIDFVDTVIKPEQEQKIVVETPLCSVTFSNFGGIVKSLAFKNHKGKGHTPLYSISSDTLTQKEDGSFLIALDKKTPYLYEFVSNKQDASSHSVVYQVKTDDWIIKKKYTLYNDTYKIDFNIEFEALNKSPKPISPRVFVAAPYIEEIADEEINGFVTSDGSSVNLINRKEELAGVWGVPEIFGAEDKYFAHGLVKDSSQFSQGGYFKRVNKKLFMILDGQEIKANKSSTLSFYIGPKLLNDLSAVDNRLEDLLAFGWLSFLCKWFLKLLELLYKYIGNFGIAIIILTILLKIPFVPLSISSRRKMEEYQKFQPTIQRIREKYKGDMQTMQQELVRFHQEHNLSSATPLIGCLPLLIQLPILFALYKILGKYLALYQAPFFGWITDLSAKDPYYILPILMGATMIIQQSMTPIKDQKQRMLMLFMPVLMTAIFINFPAGLVLYWFVNNLLTIGEDVLRKKMFG